MRSSQKNKMLVPRAFSSPVGIPASRVIRARGALINQNVIRCGK